jgi:hypothetical protein
LAGCCSLKDTRGGLTETTRSRNRSKLIATTKKINQATKPNLKYPNAALTEEDIIKGAIDISGNIEKN